MSASPPSSDTTSESAVETSYVDLGNFCNRDYDPGRGLLVRMLWYYVSLLLFEGGWFPLSGIKTLLLKCFGAKIGQGLVIKTHVRIKNPWRLVAGDHCWIGQEVWIDNIADVTLGDHVCVSQRSYLCTGNHDHRRRTFDLSAEPIRVGPGAWLGAASVIVGGVTVHANALVAAGSVVVKDVDVATIVGGSPAIKIGTRRAPESACGE